MAITLKQQFENRDNWKNFYQGDFVTYKQKYDKDISGGGYSGQPFIKRPIPSGPGNSFGQYYDLTTQALSLDFPIRGGKYEEIASREDFARIDRFFLQYPQGQAFTDKQRLLLRSNPAIETGRERDEANTRVFSSVDQGNGVRLGSVNMLEQIASVGVGFHIPNAGTDPFSLTIPQNLYEQVVAKKDKYENRLVSLYNLKILQTPDSEFNQDNKTVRNTGVSVIRDSVELLNYNGGPNSLYGNGTTLIRKATDNTGAIINTGDAPLFVGPSTVDLRGNTVQSNGLGTINVQLDYNNFVGAQLAYNSNLTGSINDVNDRNFVPNLAQQSGSLPTSPFTSTYAQLMKRGNEASSSLSPSDFRKNVENSEVVASNNYSDKNINIATRVGIGNPGSRSSRLTTNLNNTNNGLGQDKVNLEDIRSGESNFQDSRRDLIKFGFDVLNNDTNEALASFNFRAFLTGYTDNHSSEWQSKRYAGRGENFYTYQGFQRQVGFNFKIAAQSKQEMKPLYNKLNGLLSTLYPDYNSAGFMRGNIVRLTVGNLFYKTPGILESLNLTVNDNYPWEIAFDSPEGGSSADMLETPQIIDVAVSFKPILENLPKLSSPILIPKNGAAKLPTPIHPYLSNFKTEQANSSEQRVGTVEVGQGEFGGPFDNGNFVDISNI